MTSLDFWALGVISSEVFLISKKMTEKVISATMKRHIENLEQRQYKNDSTESRCMLLLKLPPFFPLRLAEWTSAAISKQTFVWTPSSRSYIILALGSHYGSWEFPLASGCLWKSNKSIHCVANSLLQVAFKRWHEWGHLQEHSFLLIFWVPFSTWSFVQ